MESMELLGMSEAARRLRIHLSTLRRWDETGKLKPMRDSGNRRLFFGADVDKLARERAAKQDGAQ
jgi:excisionase family DNA binding protein